MIQFLVSLAIQLGAIAAALILLPVCPELIEQRYKLHPILATLIFILAMALNFTFGFYFMKDLIYNAQAIEHEIPKPQFNHIGKWVYFLDPRDSIDEGLGIYRLEFFTDFDTSQIKTYRKDTYDRWNSLFRSKIIVVHKQDTLDLEYLTY